MIPEKVFEKILVLGDGWRVQQVDYVEQESKVLIRIEETAALWGQEACPHCRIPEWKLQKYNATHFKRKYGSQLRDGVRPEG